MRLHYYFYLFAGLLTSLNAQEPLYNYTFTGGMQGWMTNSIECGGQVSDKAQWLWIDDGMIDQGAYSNFGLMNSRTFDSGIVMLNSDFLDNKGLDDNIGNGDCPAPQIAELISPSMDFSSEDSVFISFNQLYYRFVGYYNQAKGINDRNSTATFVAFSTDGGNTWPDTMALNENINTFRATRNYLAELTLDISDIAAGQSDVKVKFIWKGDYYVWAIDDVRLYGGRKDDLDISAFKYPARNFETPRAEIKHDTMRFVADVVNHGNQTVDSAYLYIIIRSNNAARTEYFRDSLLLENMEPNDTMEVELPNYFIPENLEPGSYVFIYRLRNTKRPAEVNLANNIQADLFLISEKQFRKTDRGEGRGFSFTDDVIIGNYYEINKMFQGRLMLDKINFSAFASGNDKMAGKEVVVYLLQIDDVVAADLSDWNLTEATENKKSIVGIGSYTFTAEDDGVTDPNHRFEVSDFVNLDNPDSPIILEPGGRYIAAIEYMGDALSLIHDLGQRIIYYPELGPDQFNTMVYNYSQKQWFTGGFADDFVAIVGMDVMMEMTPAEELLTHQEMQIFPNPTSDYVRVRMNLDRPQDLNVVLTDVSGKIINSLSRQKYINGDIQLDVQSVPAGTYFLNVTTADKMKTTKISVVH